MKIKDIIDDLADGQVEITFTKVDGTTSVLRGTLDPDLILEDQGKTAAQTTERYKTLLAEHDYPDTIAVYDLDKGNWRSFHPDRVTKVKPISDIDE